jgi:hypothetical protein
MNIRIPKPTPRGFPSGPVLTIVCLLDRVPSTEPRTPLGVNCEILRR